MLGSTSTCIARMGCRCKHTLHMWCLSVGKALSKPPAWLSHQPRASQRGTRISSGGASVSSKPRLQAHMARKQQAWRGQFQRQMQYISNSIAPGEHHVRTPAVHWHGVDKLGEAKHLWCMHWYSGRILCGALSVPLCTQQGINTHYSVNKLDPYHDF